MAKFSKLDVPRQWKDEFTKYPHGYTIFEALCKWVKQVDNMVDNINNWNDYLDNFVERFDSELQEEVQSTIEKWQNQGLLDAIIESALTTELDDLNTELDDVKAQLAQKAKQDDLVVERARIDSLTTLSEGSTTGDAELIDARIGADGVTYDNVGGAIRGQIDKINNDYAELENIILPSISGGSLLWESGTIRADGELVSNTARIRTTNFIKCIGQTIKLDNYTLYKQRLMTYGEDYQFLNAGDFKQQEITLPNVGYAKIILSKVDDSIITDAQTVYSHFSLQRIFNPAELIDKNSINFNQINFIKGGNLWEGYRDDGLTVYSGLIDVRPDGKQSIISITLGKTYKIKVEGTHNRFIVDTAPNLNIGTPATRLEFWNGGNTAVRELSELSFTSDINGYLLINTAHIPSFPDGYEYTANISIYGEFIEIGEKIKTFEAKENSIDGKYLKDGTIEKSKLNFIPSNNSDTYITIVSEDYPRTNTLEVYADYDTLVNLYPDYASMNVLGLDDFNNEIREYVFKTPDYNSRTDNPRNQDDVIIKPKILITTGIHGGEKTPVLAYFKFFKDLAENTGIAILGRLREAVEFRIIPVSTPSAYNGNKRLNDNGVNINRNFDAGWVIGVENGANAASELETQIIQTWLETHDDAMVYMDVHNTGYTTEKVWISTKSGTTYRDYIRNAFFKTINSLSQRWRNDYGIAENVNLGYSGEFVFAGAQQYGDSLNIPSCLPEIAWDVTADTTDTTMMGPVACAMAQEFLGNFLIKLSKDYID